MPRNTYPASTGIVYQKTALKAAAYPCFSFMILSLRPFPIHLISLYYIRKCGCAPIYLIFRKSVWDQWWIWQRTKKSARPLQTALMIFFYLVIYNISNCVCNGNRVFFRIFPSERNAYCSLCIFLWNINRSNNMRQLRIH